MTGGAFIGRALPRRGRMWSGAALLRGEWQPPRAVPGPGAPREIPEPPAESPPAAPFEDPELPPERREKPPPEFVLDAGTRDTPARASHWLSNAPRPTDSWAVVKLRCRRERSGYDGESRYVQPVLGECCRAASTRPIRRDAHEAWWFNVDA